MTPGARVAAAIEILDLVNEGQAVEKALTSWARRSRFAGSKDRAAIRDYVFDCIRNWRSDAIVGGGETGRARMIGRLRGQDADVDALFNGQGHAPHPLDDAERNHERPDLQEADAWNLQPWVIEAFKESLGDQAFETAKTLQQRAPITLRVNLAKATVENALQELEDAGITAVKNPVCATALTITEGARKLRNSTPYQEGWVELQDAGSQALLSDLPAHQTALDYCAGGGGKALAMAAMGAKVTAHDIDFDRMSDLPARAQRAGASIKLLAKDMLKEEGPFDLVLTDVPCSGSGAWRRAPEGKWTLDAQRLAQLNEIQDQILDEASELVREGGHLIYATCSVLKCENEDRKTAFLSRNTQWRCVKDHRFHVREHNDGFYYAEFVKK